MQLGQALVRDPEPDRGDDRLDRVDVLPVDEPLRAGRPRSRASVRYAALQAEPAEEPGGADVDRHEAQVPIDLVEAEIVDPDDLAAVDVDDLLVQQVGSQQDLVGALLESRDVDRRAGQAGAARVEGVDRRPGQEDAASVGLDDEPGHRWVRSPTATMRSAILPTARRWVETGRPIAWLK